MENKVGIQYSWKSRVVLIKGLELHIRIVRKYPGYGYVFLPFLLRGTYTKHTDASAIWLWWIYIAYSSHHNSSFKYIANEALHRLSFAIDPLPNIKLCTSVLKPCSKNNFRMAKFELTKSTTYLLPTREFFVSIFDNMITWYQDFTVLWISTDMHISRIPITHIHRVPSHCRDAVQFHGCHPVGVVCAADRRNMNGTHQQHNDGPNSSDWNLKRRNSFIVWFN